MLSRLFAGILLATLLVACDTPYKKSDAEAKKPLKDSPKDPSFLAFLGRLRIAVRKHDRVMLASMMAPDFGYRWDNPTAPESPFEYWDAHKTWGALSDVLQSEFVPNGNFLVAPPEIMNDPSYAGYRAGMRLVNGSWRFAYFVPTEGAQ